MGPHICLPGKQNDTVRELDGEEGEKGDGRLEVAREKVYQRRRAVVSMGIGRGEAAGAVG
jgi:hypothetical protein